MADYKEKENISEIQKVNYEKLDFVNVFGDCFPHLVDKILSYLHPSKFEDCRQVSPLWKNYLRNAPLLNKDANSGSVWVETNRFISVQKVFSLPANHTIQDFIYDAQTNRAVVFHTTTCYKREMHHYVTKFEDFSLPNQQAMCFRSPTGWVSSYSEDDHMEPDIFAQTITEDKVLENPLQRYHQETCLFFKDMFSFIADNARAVRYFNFPKMMLGQSDFCEIPIYHLNIKQMENTEAGLYIHGLIIKLNDQKNIDSLDLGSATLRVRPEASDDIYECYTQKIYGSFKSGIGFGVGLQVFHQFGIISTGLGTGLLFQVAQHKPEKVNFINIDFSIALNKESEDIERIPIKHIKLICCNNYFVATGNILNINEEVQVIKCFNGTTGKSVWETVCTKNDKVKNMYTSGDYLFWTIKKRNEENGVIENSVHGWKSSTGCHMKAIKIPERINGAKFNLEFDTQPWISLENSSHLIPMKTYREIETHIDGYSLFLLSVVSKNKMKLTKVINIGLHNHGPNSLNSKIKFFCDKSGVNLYMVELEDWRPDHPGSRVVSFSLKNPNPWRKIKFGVGSDKILHITSAELIHV